MSLRLSFLEPSERCFNVTKAVEGESLQVSDNSGKKLDEGRWRQHVAAPRFMLRKRELTSAIALANLQLQGPFPRKDDMLVNRIALTALFVVTAAGCVTVQKVPAAEFIPAHNPSVVWVTTNDNAFTPVATPRIEGDSLKGTWNGLQDSVSFSLDQIQYVQAKLPSPKRTVILATVVGVVATSAVYSIATAGTSGRASPGYECQPFKGGIPNPTCCSVTADPGDKGQQC